MIKNNVGNLTGGESGLKISHSEIEKLLLCLSYNPTENQNIWGKQYSSNYKIFIDFDREKIIYSSPISLGDETTSNFSSSENFVVLECVDRLLTIGYEPSSIFLEHKWSLGRTNKGKLDILIKDKENKTYLMIECKTYGAEYQKEKNRMLKDGGQLMSYYQQDRNAQYLCLYASKLQSNKVEYINDIVKVEEDFRNLADVKEVYQRWNKQFNQNGIFNESPYQIKLKAITRKDLKELKEDDSSVIYNQFLEILRHNVVSDKANAFNKIFNLFLCKVLDEDKSENAQLDFQWIEGKDNFQELLKRLNDLYKSGMQKYLQKEITDYNDDDFKKYEQDEKLIQMLEELRLYKNQEFAFLEVFNKSSFEENAQIVKEVVQLLQGWQIRYSHKQQFLGEFFELLLNTGFKQESGQFFTPVPLVRFILKSLPIQEIIAEKLKNNEDNFLPYLIDFACGSGHFLTEAMDIIQGVVNDINNVNLTTTQEKKLKHYKEGDFEWAKEFIYGIEKDYRLVKTTKLACFLHGDGEAQIIHASGIAPFGSEGYKNKLEQAEQFDLLVANPPYSVSGFKSTIKEGSNSFDLFNDISDNSSEIEVLFIERMLQLLKPRGIGAIILPSSILSNAGNYERARRLILSNFEVKAIVNIGSGGFMATGTSTVILFLKKLQAPIAIETRQDYQKITKDKSIVIIKSGDKDEEKRFLGYEFSNRRGNEGLKKIGNSLLFDENNINNPNFANSYILKAMRGDTDFKIEESIKNHVEIMQFSDCFDFDTENFINSIQLKKKLQITSKYDLVKLGDIASVKKGDNISKDIANIKGNIPVIAGGKKSPYNHDKYNSLGNCITIGASGEAGYVWYHNTPIWASDSFIVKSNNTDTISNKYIYFILKHMQDIVYSLQKGSLQKHVYEKDLVELSIPFVNLKEQNKIVSLIEEQEQLIDKANFEIESINKGIKDINLINYEEEYLGNICDIVRGGSPRPISEFITEGDGYNWIKISDATNGDGKYILKTKQKIRKEGLSHTRLIKSGSLLLSNSMTVGKPYILGLDGCIHDGWLALTIKNDICLLNYLYYILNSSIFYQLLKQKSYGTVVKNININIASEIKIPLPSIKEQEKIVSLIENKETLIKEHKNIIYQAKQKQKDIISEILLIE